MPKGRPDWVGWFELIREDLIGEEIDNTGRVIEAVRPDVLCLVEVEDRLSLNRFNDQVLQFEFRYPFRTNMLVDGNDERGIDIGLFSQLPIGAVRSFTDLPTPGKTEPVFSRDCPMFDVLLPDGRRLIVLGNHLKSQGYGNKAANDARRLAQATAVAGIYEEARARSDLVAVCGDLNAGPDDPTIAPLVQGTDLRDVMQHQSYVGQPGALPGTFGSGKALKQKLDYVLALTSAVANGTAGRRGASRRMGAEHVSALPRGEGQGEPSQRSRMRLGGPGAVGPGAAQSRCRHANLKDGSDSSDLTDRHEPSIAAA